MKNKKILFVIFRELMVFLLPLIPTGIIALFLDDKQYFDPMVIILFFYAIFFVVAVAVRISYKKIYYAFFD